MNRIILKLTLLLVVAICSTSCQDLKMDIEELFVKKLSQEQYNFLAPKLPTEDMDKIAVEKYLNDQIREFVLCELDILKKQPKDVREAYMLSIIENDIESMFIDGYSKEVISTFIENLKRHRKDANSIAIRFLDKREKGLIICSENLTLPNAFISVSQ